LVSAQAGSKRGTPCDTLACVWLRAIEMEISPALRAGPIWLGKTIAFLTPG